MNVDGLLRRCQGLLPEKPAARLFWGSLGILAATVCVYWPSLGGMFIWDDNVTLTDNPLIVAPGGLSDIWFSTQPHDYWPLHYTSLWLEWRLWGLNPTGYRIVNLLLHAGGSVLLWRVLLRLRIPGAWLAALLFAIHPVCVATVAWITERKNTLSLVFYLLSILCYLRFDTTSRITHHASRVSKWYWLSLAAFVLALLSKTSVVMLPLVLLLCVWWQRTGSGNIQRSTSSVQHPSKPARENERARSLAFADMARTAPFFALSLIMGLVTVWFQTHRAIGAETQSGPLLERLIAGTWALWFYLYKAVVPVNLSVLYERWVVDTQAVISYLPLVGWLVLLVVCWRSRNRWGRPFLAALGYFTITLLPVLGFFDMSYLMFSRVADHWQYLALIGPVTLLGGGMATLVNRASAGWKSESGTPFSRVRKWESGRVGTEGALTRPLSHFRTFPLSRLAAVPVALLVVLLAVLSLQRSVLYADSELLWRDALRKDPNSLVAYNDLGVALVNKGRLDEAFPVLEKAVMVNPQSAAPHNNLGMALFEKGQVDEALPLYRQALNLDPGYVPARFNLAVALARKEEWHQAAEQYQMILQMRPKSAEAHNNLGNALARLGQTNEATFHYSEAVRLRPAFAEAQNNLGNAMRLTGRPADAIRHYQNAIRLRPTYPNARYWLAEFALRRGQAVEAADHYAHALAEKPDYAEAHIGMARAWAAQGRISDAIHHLDEAIKAQPDASPAYYQLGNLLLSQGMTNEVMARFSAVAESRTNIAEAHYFIGVVLRLREEMPGAIDHWRKAVQLRPNWVEALNNLAWHLATQPNRDLRNGAEALELSQRAADLTRHEDPEVLDTLAAAYAEVGNYHEAAETVRKALALAQASGQSNLLAGLQEQLSRYLSANENPKE